MSVPESKAGSSAEGRKTRIDAPHAVTGGAEATAAAKGPATASVPGTMPEELQRQARQLETHLQKRQLELDHRESQLNARLAEFERESRAARLWFAERERELSAVQASMTRTSARETRPGSAQTSDTAPAAPGSDNLIKRELDLDKREQEVSQREQKLRKLRDELVSAREETLEIRLATEELWRQLCDALPPEAVNRSIARIRQRLTEHYRLVREDLNDYRSQLEDLRCNLDEKLELWTRRKAELAQWVTQRMTEVDQYHATVAERSVALDQKQTELALLQSAWRQDRQELESRIARLQGRLDQAAGPKGGIPAPHSAVGAGQPPMAKVAKS